MASEKGRAEEILGRVLELSLLQRRLLDEKRFEELASKQKERETLFIELQGLPGAPYREEPLRSIIVKILDNDRVLSLSMESSMGEISMKLGRIKKGSKAAKAYSARG